MATITKLSNGYCLIHVDLRHETDPYETDTLVTVNGDWYVVGPAEKNTDSGWDVPLMPCDRPERAAPAHILFADIETDD